MKRLYLHFFLLVTLQVFSQNSLTTSLTACYALNGNANEPINNLAGTLSAVTPTVDRFNNPNSACQFAGNAGSYIELPNNALIKPNAVSFSAWVKTNISNSSQYIVFTNNTCVNYHEGYMLSLGNFGSNIYRLQAGKSHTTCSAGGQIILNGATNISSNTWNHVGLYIGADSMKVYLNGVLDGSVANANPVNYNPIKNVYLGGSNLAVNIPFSGTMDNVRFYNRKLTGTEFNQLYTQDPSCAGQVVGLPPVVSFSVSSINLCAGTSISMTDLSANAPTSWNWQIPGANPPTASVSNPTISFQNPGNYIISLVSSNTVGASNTATQSIVVLPNPNVTAVANNTFICIGQSTNLFASGASNYTWSTQQTGVSISVSPIVMTTYSLLGIDNNGCKNTATVSIGVNPSPVISIQANSLSICIGSSVSLVASGANFYTWNNSQTGAMIVSNPSASSIYSVTGTSINGCVATANISITVNPLPSLTITATKKTICKGESVVLTASGALTYTWNNNQNGAVINLSPPSSNTYSVIGVDNNGCQNSSAFTIFVENCVGVKKVENENLFSVFPNPNNGNFNIELGSNEEIELILSNSLGQIVLNKSVQPVNNRINVDLISQNSGIYFLKLKINGNNYTKKIIKN